MKISFVRGAYLNNYEGQNFDLPLIGFSSLFPIDDHVSFPVKKLLSIADLQRIPILEKPIKYIANRTLGDSQILFGLERHIHGSDIVHVGDPHYYYSYQAAKMRERGEIKKLVSTWWETIPFNNESTKAKKRIKKFTMSLVDMFVCYSRKSQVCLIAEGVSKEKIVHINLGVDLQRFQKQRINHKIFTILFVGRLVEEKGVKELYEAFKEISQRNPDVHLKIVGTGPLESTLKSYIESDNLTSKVTISRESYSDMPRIYSEADVLCVPSRKIKTWEEQLGMVFIEAMASGLPIIATKTGSIPEIVDSAGLYAKQNTAEELSTLIIQIIRINLQDTLII